MRFCPALFRSLGCGDISCATSWAGVASGYSPRMGAARWQVDQLVEDVALLGQRGLPREEYYGEVAGRLRRVVDCDATCWHTLDPQTRLITSDAGQELIDAGVFTPENDLGRGSIDPGERVLRRGREHVRGPCSSPGPGRDPQPGDQRQARTQCPLPRPARALGDPIRAPGGLRQQRTLLGSGSHRPPRKTSPTSPPTTQTWSRGSPARSRTGSAPRFASTRPRPPAKARLPGSSCSARTMTSS